VSAIVVCLAAVLLSACGQEPNSLLPQEHGIENAVTDKEAIASHEKMERTLSDLHARLKTTNPFYGTGAVRRLESELGKIDRAKETARYVEGLMQLGRANVDYGNLSDAIQQLTAAYRIVDHFNAPPVLRREAALRLGIAHLRLAESENCCASFSPESCILPLRGAAIHTKRAGSEAAIRYLIETMQLADDNEPLQLLARWLLNLAYMTLGDYPDKTPEAVRLPASILESEIEFPRFKNVAATLGLATDSLAGGVIADDFDGDGDFDLIVSNWHSGAGFRYFENRQAAGFVDRSEDAGVSRILGGLNMVQADYDNDGDLDILVLRGAWLAKTGTVPNSLLRNEGKGTFFDVTFAAGLAEANYPTQTAAWTDYDNDGDLDVYIGNEQSNDTRAPCQLFRNEGNGTFTDVADVAGVTNGEFTKAVVCGDLDNDRWPDIVVSNFSGPNRLYHNNGDGTFSDIAGDAGIRAPKRSFPAWIWDYDNDGNLDIFISSYSASPEDYARQALGKPYPGEISGHYRGDGSGGFTNLAREQGFEMPMLTMGSNFGDLNNDGFPDLYLGTGDPEIHNIMPNPQISYGGVGTNITANFCGRFIDSPPLFPL
jgi:hypothetical protein